MEFLVVDDSRPTRNLIKNYVSEIKIGEPCYFLEAEDGENALKLLKTRHVDFVLLDWNLSTTMTGLDVLKIIRSSDKLKKLPVIMITGESDKQNVIESIKSGANDFAIKPIDKKLFAEKILKAITTVK
ncbi:MAG: response regulator [Spirochaetes bacterium]|nr:response regulator [Spirochaetota bacterium]